MNEIERMNCELWEEFQSGGPKTKADYELWLVERLRDLQDAARAYMTAGVLADNFNECFARLDSLLPAESSTNRPQDAVND